jgi:hypothetical protein
MRKWIVYAQEVEKGYRHSLWLEGDDEDDVIRRAVAEANPRSDVLVWTLDITDRPGRLVRVKMGLDLT